MGKEVKEKSGDVKGVLWGDEDGEGLDQREGQRIEEEKKPKTVWNWTQGQVPKWAAMRN